MLRNIIVIFSFLISQQGLCQTTITTLLKTEIDNSTIWVVDSVSREEISGSYNSFFYRVFSTENNNYLFHYRRTTWMPPYEREEWFIYSESDKQQILSEDWVLVDGFFSEPYLSFSPYSEPVQDGIWITLSAFGSFFISNEDSVFLINDIGNTQLRAIAGKIGEKHLIVVNGPDPVNNYFNLLVDIDNPQFSISDAPNVFFEDNSRVIRLKEIINDIYLVYRWSDDWSEKSISLYQYSDKFKLIKKVIEFDHDFSLYTKWNFINNVLYVFKDGRISGYNFNPADTSFSEESILFEANEDNIAVDDDFKLVAILKDGFLKVYDVRNGSIVNSLILPRNVQSNRPIVDSPYVYFHQIKTSTDVSEKDKIKPNNYSLSAYPNPFNPSTTITYSIPVDAKVEIIIYDILGNEVTKIVSDFYKKGLYEVPLNASNLASGVYLLVMKTGSVSKTNKLILLK